MTARGTLREPAGSDQREAEAHECHGYADPEGDDEDQPEPDLTEVDRAEQQEQGRCRRNDPAGDTECAKRPPAQGGTNLSRRVRVLVPMTVGADASLYKN